MSRQIHELNPNDPYALSRAMDFDCPIAVYPDGTLTDAPSGIDAPECYWNCWGEGQHIEPSTGWELLDGFSVQEGYSGPIMHASEFIGGIMAHYIRTNPGYYVAVTCENIDDTENPAGWAVAYRPLPEEINL